MKAVLQFHPEEGINVQDSMGVCALSFALRKGLGLVAKWLLHRGANPCLSDNLGITALHWLPFLPDEDMVDVADMLILRGADIDATMSRHLDIPEHTICFLEGSTPLQFAVTMRSLTAVRVLLERGADPSKCVRFAQRQRVYMLTAAHLAVVLHFAEIVSFFLAGSDGATAGMASVRFFGRASNTSDFEHGEISIINLVNLPTPSMWQTLGPYSRAVMHGSRSSQQRAVQSTLEAITLIYPERRVLDRTAMLPEFIDDPYTWEALKRLSFRLSTIGKDPDLESKQDLEDLLFWLDCALDASRYSFSSKVPAQVAIQGFQTANISISSTAKVAVLEKIVNERASGMLTVLLKTRFFWVETKDFARLFWKAASKNDLETMEVIWNTVINAEAYENRPAKQAYVSTCSFQTTFQLTATSSPLSSSHTLSPHYQLYTRPQKEQPMVLQLSTFYCNTAGRSIWSHLRKGLRYA